MPTFLLDPSLLPTTAPVAFTVGRLRITPYSGIVTPFPIYAAAVVARIRQGTFVTRHFLNLLLVELYRLLQAPVLLCLKREDMTILVYVEDMSTQAPYDIALK